MNVLSKELPPPQGEEATSESAARPSPTRVADVTAQDVTSTEPKTTTTQPSMTTPATKPTDKTQQAERGDRRTGRDKTSEEASAPLHKACLTCWEFHAPLVKCHASYTTPVQFREKYVQNRDRTKVDMYEEAKAAYRQQYSSSRRDKDEFDSTSESSTMFKKYKDMSAGTHPHVEAIIEKMREEHEQGMELIQQRSEELRRQTEALAEVELLRKDLLKADTDIVKAHVNFSIAQDKQYRQNQQTQQENETLLENAAKGLPTFSSFPQHRGQQPPAGFIPKPFTSTPAQRDKENPTKPKFPDNSQTPIYRTHENVTRCEFGDSEQRAEQTEAGGFSFRPDRQMKPPRYAGSDSSGGLWSSSTETPGEYFHRNTQGERVRQQPSTPFRQRNHGQERTQFERPSAEQQGAAASQQQDEKEKSQEKFKEWYKFNYGTTHTPEKGEPKRATSQEREEPSASYARHNTSGHQEDRRRQRDDPREPHFRGESSRERHERNRSHRRGESEDPWDNARPSRGGRRTPHWARPQASAPAPQHLFRDFVPSKLLKMPRYSGYGDPQTPSEFLKAFKRYMAANPHISRDLFATQYISCALDDEALEWYDFEREYISSWDHFEYRLTRKYEPTNYQELLHREIEQRTQHWSEPLPSYIQKMQCYHDRLERHTSNQERVERVKRQMHPEYREYMEHRRYGNLYEMFEDSINVQEKVQRKREYKPPPAPEGSVEPSLAFRPRLARDRVYRREEDERPPQYMSRRNLHEVTLDSFDPQRANRGYQPDYEEYFDNRDRQRNRNDDRRVKFDRGNNSQSRDNRDQSRDHRGDGRDRRGDNSDRRSDNRDRRGDNSDRRGDNRDRRGDNRDRREDSRERDSRSYQSDRDDRSSGNRENSRDNNRGRSYNRGNGSSYDNNSRQRENSFDRDRGNSYDRNRSSSRERGESRDSYRRQNYDSDGDSQGNDRNRGREQSRERYENNKRGNNNRNSRDSRSSNSRGNRDSQGNRDSHGGQDRRKISSYDDPRFANVICYNCGKEGHLAYDCKDKKSNQKNRDSRAEDNRAAEPKREQRRDRSSSRERGRPPSPAKNQQEPSHPE